MSSKEIPEIEGYYKPLGPYSHVVVANGLVFISAQTSMKSDGSSKLFHGADTKEQTRHALSNVELLLKKSGSSLEDVVKVTVYMDDPRDFAMMNEAYREFFPLKPPARSIAKLGFEAENLKVAVDVIAIQKNPKTSS